MSLLSHFPIFYYPIRCIFSNTPANYRTGICGEPSGRRHVSPTRIQRFIVQYLRAPLVITITLGNEINALPLTTQP